MWRSWLTRQFVALEIVGSSPIFHPMIFISKCKSWAVAVRSCANESELQIRHANVFI